MRSNDQEQLDVVVIGAGISGIDAGVHLNKFNSKLSYVILERRENLGGTWDLFKYPGIRSDSDMFTFGFQFKPWGSSKPIAPGADILEYVNETAREFGVLENIRFNTNVSSADWTSSDNRWHITTDDGKRISCRFLFSCSGYFDYDTPYRPEFPGEESFPGPIVHPQFWGAEEDKLYPGKRVAIIGSGATAVTMLPNLAIGGAQHVTMVQRTPTYIVAAPEKETVAQLVQPWLPGFISHPLLRWYKALSQQLLFQFMQRYPKMGKDFLINEARKQLVNTGTMTEEELVKHFTPPYNPW